MMMTTKFFSKHSAIIENILFDWRFLKCCFKETKSIQANFHTLKTFSLFS